MGLIIDNNVVAVFVDNPSHPDHLPIYRWMDGKGRLAIGGRLLKELAKNQKFRRRLIEWMREGRAIRYPDAVVDREEELVQETGLLTSDDPHVLALARVSGVRVLFTHDVDLIVDFKNVELIPKPKGKVYQTRKNAGVLLKAPPCRPVRR